MSKIRTAVIGLGWVGINRHLKAIRRNEHYKLVGVIDRHPETAKKIAGQFNIPKFSQSESLNNISWLQDVDLVTISTPPFAHFSLATQALMLGKHVLVEKPFTMEITEAEELAKAADDAKRILAIVHNFQFSNSFSRLMHDYTAGLLGDVKSIVARQFGNPQRRLPSWYDTLPLGLFYDESPHLFYLLHRLAPNGLTLVQGATIPSTLGLNTPATIEALYSTTANNQTIPVSLHMSFEAPVSEWHIAVLGTKGMGVVDLFRDIYLKIPNDKQHSTLSVVTTSIAATLQHWTQTFTRGIQHLSGTLLYGNDVLYQQLATAIRDSKLPGHFSHLDGLQVLRLQQSLIAHTQQRSSATSIKQPERNMGQEPII